MRNKSTGTQQIALVVILLGLTGCKYDGTDTSTPLAPDSEARVAAAADPRAADFIALPFDPANFARGVENPYFPLAPGSTWSYRQQTQAGLETDEVVVMRQTKAILGVAVAVVHDQVFLDGVLKEDTFDWYAPDHDGNVWYFGEDTTEIVGGAPASTAGSWEAGKAGAKAGIIMLGHPEVGDTYQQENSPGVVADMARIKGLNEPVTVPAGTFAGCLKTQEWTPLEPGSRAFKFYARGVGTVLENENSNGGPVELIAFSRP